MGAIGGEELIKWEKMQGRNGDEEKILVLVRLRPLSEKETARSEVSDWECINDSTILYRNSLQERSGLPTAYTFDRVFRGDCATREVYEEGIKDIALSVVTGINSTIFAYGQTSSGKTYTMNGITEYSVADIYDYIQRHEERAYVLKFSAIEIYNEVVRDLLSSENASLRILDDPERGTIIEKLTEETLRDKNHLKELLSICDALRQVGETSLNETSSRSHQILRLTIESSAREFLGKDNSTTLAASVNFVDLAGSERASQSLSVGQRLKEGCHINRSLLTLGTVIRKLSKGRQGHINYRDSKLTRILQHSLGGNARTAIICTLSPARSHVEQSRNTLLFASCAKEVTTNAHVNVVMSDKALVKQLQKELARLESELRNPGPPGDYTALLRKKDLHIEKLEKEVKELKKQRDLAESRVEDLLKVVANEQASDKKNKHSNWEKENDHGDEFSESCSFNEDASCIHPSEVNNGHSLSDPVSQTNEGSEDMCKEVRCIETDKSSMEESPGFSSSSNHENEGTSRLTVPHNGDVARLVLSSASRPDINVQNGITTNGVLELQPRNSYPDESSPSSLSSATLSSTSLKFSRSRSCKANLMTVSSDCEMEEQSETTPLNGFEREYPGRPIGVKRKHWKLPSTILGADPIRISRNNSQSSNGSTWVDDAKLLNTGEEIPSVDSFVAGLKEMAKLHQGQDTGPKAGKSVKDIGLDAMLDDSQGAIPDWPSEFERMQKLLIELWHSCNISLIHRTYFFMLFKGDPMDSIYMEVEIRRLSYLKETFAKGNPAVQNGQTLTVASSLKGLRRERAMLCRLIYKRLAADERNTLYQNWGISLNSKKRRMQLVLHLWSSTTDMNNVAESAAIVAKLIRFSEQGEASKEMFGLSFSHPCTSRRSFGWKNSMASLIS
ncbi:hypothetical protein Leryth_017009 [Lithospermum erythrorhizon]|nr:hypothetical protein Leryth_017009 [Lithospermum erythrorhizon]